MAEYYKSVYAGQQIDETLGRIINGELDEAVSDAITAANAAQSAKQAIEDLGVAGITLPPGELVSVAKSVAVDGTVTLVFYIPQGEQGAQGPIGLQGLQGIQGDKGDTGAKGDKGDPVSVNGIFADETGNIALNAANVGAAVPSTQVSATLTTTWSGSGPYTQAVTIAGMTSTKNGMVGLAPSANAAQREAAKAASLMLTSQGTNTITITADGDKPTVALPIVVTMLG